MSRAIQPTDNATHFLAIDHLTLPKGDKVEMGSLPLYLQNDWNSALQQIIAQKFSDIRDCHFAFTKEAFWIREGNGDYQKIFSLDDVNNPLSNLIKKTEKEVEKKFASLEDAPRDNSRISFYRWAIRVFGDVSNIIKQSFLASGEADDKEVASKLSIGTAFIGVASSSYLVTQGHLLKTAAQRIHDKEGEDIATLYTTGGGALLLYNMAILVSKIASAAHATALSEITALSSNFFLPISSSTTLALGAYRLHAAAKFRGEMRKLLDSDEPPENKTEELLLFLKNSLDVSDEEKNKIREKYSDPAAIAREIKYLKKKKQERVKRRIGLKAYNKISAKLKSGFLQDLHYAIQTNDRTILNEAIALKKLVSKENIKQIVLNGIMIVLAITGLAAFVGSFFLGAHIPLMILFTTFVLWRVIDMPSLTSKVVDTIWSLRATYYPNSLA